MTLSLVVSSEDKKYILDTHVSRIITKTFSQSDRLMALLFNVHVRIKKSNDKSMRSLSHYLNYEVVFADYQKNNYPLLVNDQFSLSFWDKRALRRYYKKALMSCAWEMAKVSQHDSKYIRDKSKKYLDVFVSAIKYLCVQKHPN